MGAPPAKAMSSKTAPFMFFDALINILICSKIENGKMIVDSEKLKYTNENYKTNFGKTYKIKNIDKLYSQFSNYGFYLEGLKNFKFIKNQNYWHNI